MQVTLLGVINKLQTSDKKVKLKSVKKEKVCQNNKKKTQTKDIYIFIQTKNNQKKFKKHPKPSNRVKRETFKKILLFFCS